MSRFVIYCQWFVILIFSIQIVCAAGHADVVKLEDLSDYIRQHNKVLVNFCISYGYHCKSLAPAFDIAAGFLADYDIRLATVECGSIFGEYPSCDEYDINRYPTLRIYHGDPAVFKMYLGGRRAEEIVYYMSNKKCPKSICPAETATTTRGYNPMFPPKPTTPADESWIAEDGSQALFKLGVPGLEIIHPLPTEDENEDAKNLSVLLNFTISPNGRHVMLNDNLLAIHVPDPSRPPLLQAVRVPSDQKLHGDAMSTAAIDGLALTSLDYALTSRPRDDPKIVYTNYHPELYIDLIGAGDPAFPTMLDSLEQKTVKVVLYDRVGRTSDDPKRHYAFQEVQFISRGPYYRVSRPDDKTCSLWSWRCADLNDPPWYRDIWRRNFDEYGRIGCLRRVFVLRTWGMSGILDFLPWQFGWIAIGLVAVWMVRAWRRRRRMVVESGLMDKGVLVK